MIEFFPSREIALRIGGFAVHWYGLLYIAAFGLAYVLLPRLQRLRRIRLPREAWADILTSAILGVILGGRLGYVLLYDLPYFLSHPLKIFAVWEGGMSSHGGFIGVILALAWSARRSRIPLLTLGDIATVPAAFGLALGRLGNFINQELYGIPTDLPWGIRIPGVEGLRHPTALYAMGKDLFLALVCWTVLRRFPDAPAGRVGGLFLFGYGILRFLLEFLRVPTHALVDLGFVTLTRGQSYSLPLVIAGVLLLLRDARRGRGRMRGG